jgi:hypothetical protein
VSTSRHLRNGDAGLLGPTLTTGLDTYVSTQFAAARDYPIGDQRPGSNREEAHPTTSRLVTTDHRGVNTDSRQNRLAPQVQED